jgi:hypothetical protein
MATSKDVLASIAIRFAVDSANMSKSLNKIRSDMDIFKNGLKLLGKTIAGIFAVDRLVDFGKSSVNSFIESEKASNKLTTALKGNVKQFKELESIAKSRQSVTAFSDEDSINAMTRMRAILGDNMQAIKTLLPLVQDFATVKEMGLSEAADMVARSIATQTNALRRQGIEIKGAAGSTERLQSAVDSLTKAFGGQAKAIGDTLYGQLIKTRNAWDDIKESIGAVLSKPIQSSAKAWQMWAEVISSNASAWEKWKTTFAGAGKLIDMYNEKYGELNDNLKRIKKNLEIQSQYQRNADGTYLIPTGTPSTVGKIEEETKAIDDEVKSLKDLFDIKKNLADLAESTKGSLFETPSQFGENALKYTGSISPPILPTVSSMDVDSFSGIRAARERVVLETQAAYLQIQDMTYKFTRTIEYMFEDLAITFSEAIGTMIAAGAKGNWSMMLIPIADAMSNLGKLIITSAIALKVIKEAITKFATSNPLAAVAAGAALVAAAAAIKTGISNSLSGGSSSAAVPMSYEHQNTNSNIYRNYGEDYAMKVDVNLVLRNDHLAVASKRGQMQMNRY